MVEKTWEMMELMINNYVSIYDGLEEWGVIDSDKKGEDSPIFCPFHDDRHHRSAKVYADTNSIFCFMEWKLYRSFDVFVTGLNYSFLDLYNRYKDLFSDEEKLQAVKDKRFNIYSNGNLERLKDLPEGVEFWGKLEDLLFCRSEYV